MNHYSEPAYGLWFADSKLSVSGDLNPRRDTQALRPGGSVS
jgi:hypothetical protein